MENKYTVGNWGVYELYDERYNENMPSIESNEESANGEWAIAQFFGPDAEMNAKLCAEAGTIANKTGLTPNELNENMNLLRSKVHSLRKDSTFLSEANATLSGRIKELEKELFDFKAAIDRARFG